VGAKLRGPSPSRVQGRSPGRILGRSPQNPKSRTYFALRIMLLNAFRPFYSSHNYVCNGIFKKYILHETQERVQGRLGEGS